MALCRICKEFDIQSFRNAPEQASGYNYADLQNRARETGCSFCQFLCQAAAIAISKAGATDHRSLTWIHVRFSEDHNRRQAKIIPTWKIEPFRFNRMDVIPSRTPVLGMGKTGHKWSETGTQCRVFADRESAAYKSGDVKGVYLGEDRSSQDHFSMISEWLVGCRQHSACNQTLSGVKINAMEADLPTRCIEIGEWGARLKETEGSKGAYITLSHRWSKQTASVITTTENLAARMHELWIDDLPQNFRDAILTTRRLGFSYLWIDSICIVQTGDQGEDWKMEAAKMSQYYQGSILTIAAANVSDHGFLHAQGATPKDVLVRLPFRDRFGVRDGYFYVQMRRGLHGATGDYALQVLHGDLLCRGWVLQEWLLSRRILHYTDEQVFLECQSKTPINDCKETVRSQDLATIRVNKPSAAGIELSSLHQIFADATTIEDKWHRIIEAYSYTQLSFPKKDRILAVAGLATEVGLMIANGSQTSGKQPAKSTYLAGLWLRNVHWDLLWEQRDTGPRILSQCGAPTWSWAALLNPVHWRRRNSGVQNACKVIRTGGLDAYGTSGDHNSLSGTCNHLSSNTDPVLPYLILSGKLSVVLCGAHLQAGQSENLARFTGVKNELNARWIGIAGPACSTELIGWADIEMPALVPGGNEGMQALLALEVCVETGVEGGVAFDSLGLTHTVSCVLFLLPVDGSHTPDEPVHYARVGVGRIFKKNFFQNAEEAQMKLI